MSSFKKIEQAVLNHFEQANIVANYLNENPEVSGKEENSSKYIINFLKNNGYEIEAPYFDVKHSFRAYKKNPSNKKKVAILCEYDALPERGHACGHSVSCAISLLSALAINQAFPDFPFEVELIGTPDEEMNGGKIQMGEEAFKEYEFAILGHLFNYNAPYFNALASTDMEITFKGRSSHASTSPWEGVNALNALQLFFHASDMLRQHVTPDIQMHGVIVNGGIIPSIVPDKAVGNFYPRAGNLKNLNSLLKKLEDCVKGAALCTGASYEIKSHYPTFPEISCTDLQYKLVTDIFDELKLQWSPMNTPGGSTDMGFVDTVIPVFHPMIAIGNKDENIQLHSLEMTKLVKSDKAVETLKSGAKVIAGIIVALAFDSQKLELIKKQHKEYREAFA